MSDYILISVFILPALGIIPAWMARGEGRSFVLWWIYGTFLFPIAIAHVLILKLRQGRVRCPFCGKWCWASATHCSKCGYEFIRF